VFNTLLAARLLEVEDIGHGVLITVSPRERDATRWLKYKGKGYPDLATIQLVARLAACFPE